MGLRIRTNIASINAQRRLGKSVQDLKANYAKLSSGKRINKASDDAAGLAVSENLHSNIRALNMAKRNAADGMSLVQTAEGGLSETSNMLIRLRELAIQAASDTIGNREREFLDMEFLQTKEEIDRIAYTTEFNGTRLLIGDRELPEEMQTAANEFPLQVQVGKDYYEEVDSPDNRNNVNVIKLDMSNLNAFTNGEGSLGLGEYEEGTRVNRKAAAQSSINVLDDALMKVNEYRSYLGSVQNRMQSTMTGIEVQTENLIEARSRILDTDYASETAELAKNSILQQAGTAVLAQANQSGQIVMSLLNA